MDIRETSAYTSETIDVYKYYKQQANYDLFESNLIAKTSSLTDELLKSLNFELSWLRSAKNT